MTSSVTRIRSALDRHAQVGELALRVRAVLAKAWLGLLAVCGLAVVFCFVTRNPGAIAFALISLGTCLMLAVWRNAGIGLPILPIIAIQNLFIYGLPIVTHHPVLREYSPDILNSAGVEVLVFSAAATLAWRLGMQLIRPSSGISYGLPDLHTGGAPRLKRVSITLVMSGTVYLFVQKLGWLEFFFELLPPGASSLVLPLVTGATACGLFLASLFLGSGEMNLSDRVLFWLVLTIACVISAADFLLSNVAIMVIAVFTGLFWSSGRIPWRFAVVVLVLLSFFNLGKFTMRGRYWEFGEAPAARKEDLTHLPGIYTEWIGASFDALTAPAEAATATWNRTRRTSDTRQSLLERINNLQNLLFVIDAVEVEHIAPLGGSTYTLIPPLLIPRILWPDKPRAHAGQVLLNVHFGRQDLLSTFQTYVAWGLIPEAYGNFGALYGSVFLGGFLGLCFAWIENATARKQLLSLEGFVSFIVLLGITNSFEMVASVLVTSLFQSVVPIIAVSLPFLHRTRSPAPS